MLWSGSSICKASAILVFAFFLLGHPQKARAADDEKLIRTGEHYGMWHADEAKFTIDKVDEKGKFSGNVELLDGLYKGAKFDFTGELTEDGAIQIKRSDCDQVCKAEAPEQIGHHHVWRGKTYIAETKAKLLFELRVRENVEK
jgi:hypothetical protein